MKTCNTCTYVDIGHKCTNPDHDCAPGQLDTRYLCRRYPQTIEVDGEGCGEHRPGKGCGEHRPGKESVRYKVIHRDDALESDLICCEGDWEMADVASLVSALNSGAVSEDEFAFYQTDDYPYAGNPPVILKVARKDDQ